jgi:hypothetical protein
LACVITKPVLQRLKDAGKNANTVIPRAHFARGICFFYAVCEKSRFLAALGVTPAALFP